MPQVAAGADPAAVADDRAAERELLGRARRGDAQAFADLVSPHQRRLFNLALRMVGDRDLAADLVQDALLRAYLSLGRFRGEARVATWLCRIVHNASLDALRWLARHPRQAIDDAEPGGRARVEPADPGPGPEAAVLQGERNAALLRALAELEPEFRAAVVLRDVQGMAYDEAAAVAGIPVGTLKSRLHRARRRLRELLDPSGVLADGGLR